jgi:hypothetical protein
MIIINMDFGVWMKGRKKITKIINKFVFKKLFMPLFLIFLKYAFLMVIIIQVKLT